MLRQSSRLTSALSVFVAYFSYVQGGLQNIAIERVSRHFEGRVGQLDHDVDGGAELSAMGIS